MPFGQLVVGPPGSGKTTYCDGMQQFYRATGRKVALINLDPANDNIRYNCDGAPRSAPSPHARCSHD